MVGVPLVNLPQGDTCALGGDPLPSPPPCGWSHAFLATPLTVGLTPNLREVPALCNLLYLCCRLLTLPITANDSLDTLICHPELSFTV